MKDIFEKIFYFTKRYWFFILPAVLFLLFMSLLVFSFVAPTKTNTANSPSPTQTTSVNSSPAPSSVNITGSPQEASGSGDETDEKKLSMWSNAPFSPNDVSGDVSQTTLADGSTQYSYASDDISRPNIVIVKNGINIYEQTPFTNTPLSDNLNYYGTPEYTAVGSQYWGANAITYIYLSIGIAFVGDPKSNQMYEQMIFQPTSIDQFLQYDTDITGQVVSPSPAP